MNKDLKDKEDIIPENNEGSQSNTESSKECDDNTSAIKAFQEVKRRLFDIKGWHCLGGTMTAEFELTDEHGEIIDGEPKEGNYFRISIPAPSSGAGEGFDWVRVEDITESTKDDEEIIAITVRPASSPVNDNEDIAHFFSNAATSSFIVKRDKNKITAGVYGRNEKPNISTESVKDKIRNAAVAAGAITAFSKVQWKSLVNGLIN